MDFCIHDLFFEFCLYHYPVLLDGEDEVFELFVCFIHVITKQAIRRERERHVQRPTGFSAD